MKPMQIIDKVIANGDDGIMAVMKILLVVQRKW